MANANYTAEIRGKRASVAQVEKTATLLMERSGGGGEGLDMLGLYKDADGDICQKD